MPHKRSHMAMLVSLIKHYTMLKFRVSQSTKIRKGNTKCHRADRSGEMVIPISCSLFGIFRETPRVPATPSPKEQPPLNLRTPQFFRWTLDSVLMFLLLVCWLMQNPCINAVVFPIFPTWATEKKTLTFPYNGCLIGILVMVFYNPHITGQYIPLPVYTALNNQGTCF